MLHRPRYPSSRSDRQRSRPNRSRPLRAEPLEDRMLLSVAPAPSDAEAWRSLGVSIDHSEYWPAAIDPGPDSFTIQDERSNQQIGADLVHEQFGLAGAGYAVAVIDTGINYRHPDLAANYLGGWDFVDDDSNPMDEHGHGTHVAGIVAGRDSTNGGVAPDAGLIALRVLNAQGSGNFGDVYDALMWVADHAAEYHIVAVNMSLAATGGWDSNPYPNLLATPLNALQGEGVFVAAAAGNGWDDGMRGLAYPAIDDRLVSVGAVYNSYYGAEYVDELTWYSQRSNKLELVAPGSVVYSTALGGGYVYMQGTSMATPVVAGAAALVYEAYAAAGLEANQANVLDTLQTTGVPVYDPETGLTFSRIDVHAAVESLALGDDASFSFTPAKASWTPLAGNWDGNGVDGVGLYDAKNGTFYLKNELADGSSEIALRFGPRGERWKPVAGDWDGDGVDTVGLYNPKKGTFYLTNELGPGEAQSVFRFGPRSSGRTALAGDWDGDGTDSVGLYDPTSGTFYLRDSVEADSTDVAFRFGPKRADWQPEVGDWNGDAIESVGLVDPGSGTWYVRDLQAAGSADATFQYGAPGGAWKGVSGDWDGDGVDTSGLYQTAVGRFRLSHAVAAAGSAAGGDAGAAAAPAALAGTWIGAGGSAASLSERISPADRWLQGVENPAGTPAAQFGELAAASHQAAEPTATRPDPVAIESSIPEVRGDETPGMATADAALAELGDEWSGGDSLEAVAAHVSQVRLVLELDALESKLAEGSPAVG